MHQFLRDYIFVLLAEKRGKKTFALNDKILQKMHRQMLFFEREAMKAYEEGNFELAEEMDAKYEELAEKLESIAEEMDDSSIEDPGHVTMGGVEDFGFMDRDEEQLRQEMIMAYSEFVEGSVSIQDQDDLLARLRGIVSDYQYHFTSGFQKLDPNVTTDEYLISLAKELYEEEKARRERLSSRRGKGTDTVSPFLKKLTKRRR